MNDSILQPIADSIYNYMKWFIKCWKDDKFDFNNFFRTVNLKNKDEIYPRVVKTYNGELGKVYVLSIPIGLDKKSFEKYKEALEIQIGKSIRINLINQYIEIELIEKVLKNEIPYKLQKRIKSEGIKIPIGQSITNEIVLDLELEPMTYIVGTTGSGKSVCTKGILSTLVNLYTPDELSLYLGDLKRVELSMFSNIKHCKRFEYTVEGVTDLIADMLEEIKDRYDMFMRYEVTSIFQYNKIPGIKKLKYQILYIEEIVMLLEDKSKKAMKLLKQLISIGRAAGCYVFLTTQRPSNDVIDNVVKANINNRICFKVEDSKNSIVALDQLGGENLRGSGHGIIKRGPNVEEFQCYYITDQKVKEIIRPYLCSKKELSLNKYKNSKVDNTKSQDENSLEDLSFLDIL